MPEDALIVRLQLASVSLLFVLKQATCLNIFPWCDSFKMPNLSFFTKLTSCLKKIRMQVSTWKPIEKNTLVTGGDDARWRSLRVIWQSYVLPQSSNIPVQRPCYLVSTDPQYLLHHNLVGRWEEEEDEAPRAKRSKGAKPSCLLG